MLVGVNLAAYIARSLTLPKRVRVHGLAWCHWPIRDQQPPDARFEQRWQQDFPAVRQRLEAGEGKIGGLALQHDEATREGWQGPCGLSWLARPLAGYATLEDRDQAMAEPIVPAITLCSRLPIIPVCTTLWSAGSCAERALRRAMLDPG